MALNPQHDDAEEAAPRDPCYPTSYSKSVYESSWYSATTQAGWTDLQGQAVGDWADGGYDNIDLYQQPVYQQPPNTDLTPQWTEPQEMASVPVSMEYTSAEYLEGMVDSTISPCSERDLAPPTISSTGEPLYNTAMTPLGSNDFTDQSTSSLPFEAMQPTGAYFDLATSTGGLPGLYSHPLTVWDPISAVRNSVTAAPILEPVYHFGSSSNLREEYPQPYYQQCSHDHSYIREIHAIDRASAAKLSLAGSLDTAEELPPRVTEEEPTDLKPELTRTDVRAIAKHTRANTKTAGKTKRAFLSNALLKAPKTEPVSRQTSCWRCRRYKKPCNGKGSVCDACVTSGFRIWSTDIGCKRGDMTDFIFMLIPNDVESRPIKIEASYVKPQSFRQSSQLYPSGTLIPASAARGDAWDQFLYKIQSTGIHGPGVLELLQVAIRYQRRVKKPEKVLVMAARALSSATDLFKLLVRTKGGPSEISELDLTKIFVEARKVLAAAASQFLRNCLTGRIKQWFSTFLASNLNVFAFIMVGDAIAAIPLHYRSQVWPDVRKTLLQLRLAIFPTARDLLNALSKGSQPLNMSCWNMTQEGSKWVRNAEGMRLVDDDEAVFDGMKELQDWRDQFRHLLGGDSWMANQPASDLLLITSVSRMYITSKS